MKVFISWSGDRSKAVAEAIQEWVRMLIQSVEPWISIDIAKGKRWSSEISTRLGVTPRLALAVVAFGWSWWASALPYNRRSQPEADTGPARRHLHLHDALLPAFRARRGDDVGETGLRHGTHGSARAPGTPPAKAIWPSKRRTPTQAPPSPLRGGSFWASTASSIRSVPSVAKRKADAYRPEMVSYKIKSRTYTQGEGRWELFQRRTDGSALPQRC